jgi:formylglycine-generating enzyme required for sulfatase activity
MKKFTVIFCVAWLMLFANSATANNVTVSSVSLTGQDLTDHYCLVQFNIYWNNSWRTTSVPQNWDAAWVFIKYRVAGGEWHHAKLNSAGSVIPTGGAADFADSTGVFLYRDSNGTGTFSLSNVGIRWDYGDNGVSDDAMVEVRVFAIEMVYVPQGAFYFGDGAAQYRAYESPDNTQPYLIDGTTITLGTTSGHLYAVSSVGSGLSGYTVASSYPTGYDAFYCMKYELSQEQYVDFLNTLTRYQQNIRTTSDVSGDVVSSAYEFVMSGSGVVSYRNGISCPLSGLGTTDPVTFHCNYDDTPPVNDAGDGQNIACNFIDWGDLAAYADWAGLRPLTEPEYEKVCRGPNTSNANEYAWGNTSLHISDYNITGDGAPNEEITDMGENVGNSLTPINSSTIGGPARCGIFAASSTNHTRVETGAGYYGIMEMSGNLSEMVVGMFHLSGLSFTGLHGDGELTTDGLANTDYWPGINSNLNFNTANTAYSTNGVSGNAGMVQKGGSFITATIQSEISNRSSAGSTTNTTLMRVNENGGRLVRTAP